MMILLSLLAAADISARTPAPVPVPKSPYLPVIYRYADTLIEHGRDKNKGVFLSALDRHALKPLTNRPPAPSGIREEDRVGAKAGPLTGSNAEHDQNLLRLLYTLSDLSAKPKYREAADAELRWFLERSASITTTGPHEFFRPWLLWKRCFELAPDAASRFVLALPEKQLAELQPEAGVRQQGFYIRTWGAAYAQTRKEQFLIWINEWLARDETYSRRKAGYLKTAPTPDALLSLAIDCDGAAHDLSHQPASGFRSVATQLDDLFCSMPHELGKKGGFLTASNKYSHLWNRGPGEQTTAQIAMMCVSRYENTGRVAYRDLIQRAAEAYLKSAPPEDEDLWPGSLGHAISLQLAAWRSTARQVHLDKAREFADFALERFFDKAALPRASLKSNHYESITGSDTLALAMVELHLHILYITAVRYPPNTIDR